MDGPAALVTVLGAILLTTIAVCLLAGWWETIREDRRRTNVPDDSSDPWADVMPAADRGLSPELVAELRAIEARVLREQHTRGGDA